MTNHSRAARAAASQRRLHALPTREIEGWTVKPYVLSADGAPADDAIVRAAADLVDRVLASEAARDRHHGKAFSILHRAPGRDFLTVCWWVEGNELHLRLFLRRPGADFAPAPATHSLACVWELEVIAQEARAWHASVVSADEPDPRRYVLERFSGWIPDTAHP
jgi:hypothetical protein